MARQLIFTDYAWLEYLHWQQTDRKMLQRLNGLIAVVKRTSFTGIGKPEPLRGNWSGAWSRRIDDTHRLVYEVRSDDIVVLQCRYHYGSR